MSLRPMDREGALQVIKTFADTHGLAFVHGEVGFGRPCVGLRDARGNYVDYNPHDAKDYEPIWPYDRRLCAPKSAPHAYHKHDCLAVLVHGDDYNAAEIQLAQWIKHLESQGEVRVESYDTKAIGLQALFSGTTGYAIRLPGTPEPESV